jgi:hypothetical protein
MRLGPRATIAAVLLALIVVACGQGAGSPGPSQPSGSAQPSVGASLLPRPSTAADAAARVAFGDRRFAGLQPFDPNAIGQCCFYRVAETADGWLVTFEVGWGDCPAGCINRHTWTFAVDAAGGVRQVAEAGPAVPAGLPGSAAARESPGPSEPASGGGQTLTGPGVEGVATAGPTCPVMRPGDSSCADRPVAGATVHVLAADGTEVATVTTDADGAFAVPLEPGNYRVVADPAAGVMRGPEPVQVTVGSAPVKVTLSYDTGIR